MKRCQRMKHGRDFALLRKQGRSRAGRYLVLSTVHQPDRVPEGPFLAGFITTKRIGIAVVRNRVRRRLRAIVDEFADRLVPGTMMVVISRYRAPEASYATLRNEWERLAKRAGILRRSQATPASPVAS